MDFGPPIVKAFNRYADAYMRLYQGESDYTTAQCESCPYGAACCKLTVGVTPFEVAAICAFVNATVPRHIIGVVIKKIRKRARIIRDHAGRYNDGSEAAAAWLARGIGCLFHAPGHGCSIYPVRPMACRKIYSTGDCHSDQWLTMIDRDEVLKRRIEFLPHFPTYEKNVGELSSMLSDMIGDKETRIGPDFQALALDKNQMDDLDIVNPVEKKENEGVDKKLLV